MIFQVNGIATKVVTMRDKSIRIQFDTQELTPEQSAEVFQWYNKYGTLAFQEGETRIEELPDAPEYKPIEKNEKTPSQRLRAVLYLLGKQECPDVNPDTYYSDMMNKIIEHYKGKLI